MQSETWLAEPVNGCRARMTRIGTVTTTEAKTHRISYETASWYTAVEVPAGTYDVVLYEQFSTRWVMVNYHGTVVDEHFVNRVGASSSLAPKRNIGKPAKCTAQLHPFIAAEAFAANERWTLADDWRLDHSQHAHADGRPFALFSLIRSDGTAAC